MNDKLNHLNREEDRLMDEVRWARRQVIEAKGHGDAEMEARMTAVYNEEKAALTKVQEEIREITGK